MIYIYIYAHGVFICKNGRLPKNRIVSYQNGLGGLKLGGHVSLWKSGVLRYHPSVLGLDKIPIYTVHE